MDWWEKQGVSKKNLELYDVPKDELAHYSKATVDIMYKFPHGVEELEGIANRTDFDLGSHSKDQKELNLKSKVIENNSCFTTCVDPKTFFEPHLDSENRLFWPQKEQRYR